MSAGEERTRRAVVQATPSIVAALSGHGVRGLHSFVAFAGHPVVWLATATDAERDAVAARGCVAGEVRPLLARAGVRDDLAAAALVTVESEETVVRDYEGNWWYAMK